MDDPLSECPVKVWYGVAVRAVLPPQSCARGGPSSHSSHLTNPDTERAMKGELQKKQTLPRGGCARTTLAEMRSVHFPVCLYSFGQYTVA
jgi:hypothetical protein